jgi:ribokinase
MTGRILVVGDVVTDILAVQSGPTAVDSDTPATIRGAGGGSGANTAAWLAWSGATVDLLAMTGADAAGSALVSELVAAGVGCAAVVRTTEAPTGTVIVLVHGQDRTMFCDRGANLHLRPSHVDAALALLPDTRHLHLSGYTLLDEASRAAGRHALALAARLGLSSSVDASSAAPLRRVGAAAFLDWVRGVDLLLANADEAEVLTGLSSVDAARHLARTVGAAVVKLGPAGAVWARGDEVVEVPAAPAEVVDTTGAGDAFAAGLLAAHLAGHDAPAALTQAVRLGARAVGQVGGRPPLPAEPRA